MRESTIDRPSPAPVPYGPRTGTQDESAHTRGQRPVSSSELKVNSENWPRILMVAGGAGAGAALAAGSITGPLGALCAGLAGILIGVWAQTSQKSK